MRRNEEDILTDWESFIVMHLQGKRALSHPKEGKL